MTPEAWAFMGLLAGGIATIVITSINQNATTRRLVLEQQAVAQAKTETVGRKVDRSADAAELASQAAERAARNTVTVSNGTVPKILGHLEDQGAMMVQLIKQMDYLTEVSGRTRAAQDQTAGVVMKHLSDHASATKGTGQ